MLLVREDNLRALKSRIASLRVHACMYMTRMHHECLQTCSSNLQVLVVGAIHILQVVHSNLHPEHELVHRTAAAAA
jgi:hypothetical protein